jgi:hypothetical protein
MVILGVFRQLVSKGFAENIGKAFELLMEVENISFGVEGLIPRCFGERALRSSFVPV